MTPELKMHLDVIVQSARKNLAMQGHLLSVAFVISGEKDKPHVEIIGFPWHNDVEKEAGIIFLRGHARQKQAHTVVLIFEMWYANLEGQTSLANWDGVLPRNRKDRKEGVGIYVETLDGSWHGKAEIVRDYKGKPSFGEVEYMPIGVQDPRERFQSILA